MVIIMEFDLKIERIDNGYIFSGKGVTQGKHYYSSLEDFANTIIEEMRESDSKISQHELPDEPFNFKLTTDLL